MFNLPFFNKNKQKDNKFITLEINSECVKILIFYKENGTTKIIGGCKKYIKAGSVRNGVIIDFDEIINTTEQALDEAAQNIESDVKDIIVGITSDIVIENVTTAKITRSTTQQITQKDIDEFEQKILESATLDVQNKYLENTGNTEADFQMITSSTIYSKIDEQKVESLFGHSGKVVEMAMYTAYCPVYFVSEIKKLTGKLKLNLMAVATHNFSMVKALPKADIEANDMVLIQIGTDFTNVGVVFGNAVVTSKSIHIGKKHFVDEISRIMGLTFEESAKILDSYSKGELSNSEGVMVQNCILDVIDIWLEGLELLFADFTGVKTFAPNIYLFGEGTKIPEIEESLNKNPWTKAIPFKAPPEIKKLELKDLPNLTDSTGNIIDDEWITPANLSFIYEELI